MVSKRKRRNKQKQQEVERKPSIVEGDSEDYCFVCKDGGLLIVCDHKECQKAYHPTCVGQQESTEENEEPWICDWHRCLICKRNSRYQCYCCPNAICQSQSCYKDATFVRVSGSKGFCDNCLKLAMLGEEGFDVDSDGEKVDFKDRETYEGLFKEYWDIIKEKEGLTLEDLHRADVQLKKGDDSRQSRRLRKSQKPLSDSDESVKEEETKELSDDDHDNDLDNDHDSDDALQPVIVDKKKPKKAPKKPKGKGPKKIEFVGWASKPLIEFLASIGEDTSKKLTQDDVALLVNKYVHENKLLHPDKKKLILCDVRLRSLLGRKSFSVYKIKDVLEPHFLENLNQSEDEGYSSGYEEQIAPLPTKKQAWWRKDEPFPHKGSLLKKFDQKECVIEEPSKPDITFDVIYSQFATINQENMKLVYLKKSLIEKLLEQFETFESKVVGSFVKVKSDPYDVRHPYQLLPVTGIKNSGDEDIKKIMLQVSNLPNDVPIRMLSNDDISQEDCVELCQKVESGLLPKPTVVDLEKKAKELHEDITKFWINRELASLRNRIDIANEKGWRAELYDYRKRRELLQTEEEQSRLLNEIPKIIAEVIDVKSSAEETQLKDGPENVSTPCANVERNGTIRV